MDQNYFDTGFIWYTWMDSLFIIWKMQLSFMCIVHLQERASAEAENRSLPLSHTSNDVRALRLSDFIHAHEQVWSYISINFVFIYFDTLVCASVSWNSLLCVCGQKYLVYWSYAEGWTTWSFLFFIKRKLLLQFL